MRKENKVTMMTQYTCLKKNLEKGKVARLSKTDESKQDRNIYWT